MTKTWKTSRWTLAAVGVPALAALAFAGWFTAGGLLALVWPTPSYDLVEVPDSYVKLMLEAPDGRPVAAADAGEGSRARREVSKSLRSPSPNRPDSARDADPTSGRGLEVIGGLAERLESGGLGISGLGSGGGGTLGYGAGVGSMGSVGSRGAALAPQRAPTPTAFDALSTFAIDVDTASWSTARRALMAGAWPSRGQVRIEELVNAQDYAYARPASGPIAVTLEGAPDPAHPGGHLLSVALQTRDAQAHRKPVRLTLLVDVSGSMSGQDRLPLAVESLKAMVGRMGNEDSVAIVTYASGADVVLAPTPVKGAGAVRIADALSSLHPGGSTAMSDGLGLAYEQAVAAYVPGAENKVMVVSDGDANIGTSGPDGLLAVIRRHAGRGITLTTLGMGTGNLRDDVMERLADAGDGQYHHLGSRADARRVLVEGLAGTLETVVQDVKVQVAFDPEAVLSYRLLGYDNRAVADTAFRDDATDGGELGAGHAVTALYAVQLAPGAAGELATVSVRGRPPGPESAAVEWVATLSSEHVRTSLRAASPAMRLAVVTAMLGERLREGTDADWDGLARLAPELVDRGWGSGDAVLGLIATSHALASRARDQAATLESSTLSVVDGAWR